MGDGLKINLYTVFKGDCVPFEKLIKYYAFIKYPLNYLAKTLIL
jgi:hypothetical protein